MNTTIEKSSVLLGGGKGEGEEEWRESREGKRERKEKMERGGRGQTRNRLL